MPELVFVYGSLKTGFEHHDQMEGAESRGNGTLRGYRLVLYEESYPALVPSDAQHVVEGELFELSEQLLTRLDRFEECPELYQRVHVDLEDGRSAWAYVISRQCGARYPELQGAWTGRRAI